MIKSSVARRYAKALFDLLDASSVEPTRKGLIALGEAFTDSSSLKHVLMSPAFGVEDKHAVLFALSERLRCPTVVNSFLAQLVKQNRVGLLPDIAESFVALVDQSKGTEQVLVSTAKSLSSAEQQGLRTRLGAALNRKVDLAFRTDSSLLSGLHIQIGSTVVDSTIRGRLNAMQALLNKE